MASLVHTLQGLFGLAWLVPLCLYSPALWRVLKSRADALDMIRAPHWFTSLVMVLGSARWILFPDALRIMGFSELAFWATIYFIGIGAAFATGLGIHMGERLR